MELGAPAVALGAPGPCGIVVPLEAQGYEDVAAGRVTTFLPGFSPELARMLGAAACKLLLPYRPDHEASAARQDDVVREAVAGCHAEGLPLILEPIAYALPDETSEAFAALFPSLVVASAERLQALGPDVLKVQFPRDDHGDEAAWCKQLDVVCGRDAVGAAGRRRRARGVRARPAHRLRRRGLRLHRGSHALDGRDRRRGRSRDLAPPRRRAAAAIAARHRAERPAVA